MQYYVHRLDTAYCYQPSSVVCRSVCHTSEPCKNDCTNRDAVWVEFWGGPKEPRVLDGVQIPPLEGVILSGKVRSVVKHRDTLRSPVQKTAEPIEMPFGLWARTSCVRWGPAVLRYVAMSWD